MPANLHLLYGLPSLFDRLMNQEGPAGYPVPEDALASHFPPVQVFEDEAHVVVRALIPGVSLEDVHLLFDCNVLVLRGTLPAPEGCAIRCERRAGPFKREVRLPSAVLPSEAEAVMRDGLLAVTFPKDLRNAKRSIPISGCGGEQGEDS